jgi:hypothetical protein
VKQRWSRRAVLRGAGVALGLPWLESLAPRGARAAAPEPRRTFVGFFFPCGVADYWRPARTGVGSEWSLSPILEPLAPVKSHLTVLANVGNYGPFGGHIEPSHSHLTGAFLTCTKAKGPDIGPTGPWTNGVSVDQVIAQAIGGRTKLPSLQVGLTTTLSYQDGLPPEFSRSISWAAPDQPLYKTVNPQSVFDRLVTAAPTPGGAGTSADVYAASRRAAHKSVLDYVLAHSTTVRARLGRTDQAKLDEFQTSLRSLEKRVDAGGPARCAVPNRPTATWEVDATPPDYDRNAHADLMLDLVAFALECDATRVVSFMFDDSRSDFVYDFLTDRGFGTPDPLFPKGAKVGGLHGLAETTSTNSHWATINHWFIQKVARLCGRLQAVNEGAGTMLDAATVWLGSECHGGNEDGLDLPVLYVGGGAGRLRTNRFVDFAATPRRTERLANVYLTFLRGVFDLPVTTFGTAPAGGYDPNGATPKHAYGAGTDLVPEILV